MFNLIYVHVSGEMIKRWFLFVSLILQIVGIKSELCHFHDFQAFCTSYIGAHPVNIEIYFNVCHNPIDVKFVITDKNHTIRWKHTFVTSNVAETKHFDDGHRLSTDLHVVLVQNDPQEVLVKADLHIGSSKGHFIIDETVNVGKKLDCVPIGNVIVYKLVIIFAILLLLLLSAVAILIYNYQQKKKAADLVILTDNENPAGVPGSFPYQEGSEIRDEQSRVNPIVKFFCRKTNRNIQVQYTNCDNGDCVIANSFLQPNAG